MRYARRSPRFRLAVTTPAPGAAAERNDAWAKATGALRYAADLEVPGALHAALVRSPHPHAAIRRINLEEAARLAGVHSVITAADLPRVLAGRRVRDMPPLASGVARFAGEAVAAVLAESRRVAEQAAALVEVDYEELPAVLDPLAALEGRPGLVHEDPSAYPGAVVGPGDGPNLQSVVVEGNRAAAERLLAEAEHCFSATYRTPAVHQGYLEPHAWTAVPGARGGVVLRGTTKSPYRVREQIATALGLEPAEVVVEPSPLGGDFGGKGSAIEPTLCAALARACGRPVRLVLRSGEDLTATDVRHPSIIWIRLGCDGDGRLVALLFDAVFDGGAYAAAKPIPSANLHGAQEAALGYRLREFWVRSRIAYTNTVPKGHMRAPGAPQSVFAIESAIDELAASAGLDPLQIRRQSLLRSGEPDAYGHSWPDARGVETLEAATRASSQQGGGEEPRCPPGWLEGAGAAFYCRPTPPPRTSSLSLRQLDDGRFEVGVPLPETGTGSHSVVQIQLAAALGVPPDRVVVLQLPTSALGYDAGVGGSRVTAGVTASVERLVEAWRSRGERDSVVVDGPDTEEGPALTCCVQRARVAVDPETGQVKVLEILSAVDVAEVLRPRSHLLQIEGGALMGFGFACLEDLQQEDGQIWAANLGELKLPAPPDLPVLRSVLVEGGKGVGPANVKAVGELTNVPTAAAIANAVAAASGARVRELPITAERVFRALRERQA